MKQSKFLTAACFVLAVWMTGSATAQQPTADQGDVLFMVELAEGPGSSGARPLSLDVVFFGSPPEPSQVDTVLRRSLEAGIALHADQDIAARAWLRTSPSGVRRRALTLANGADGFRYVAMDQSIQDGPGGTGSPVQKDEPADDRLSTVIADGKVLKACQGPTEARMSTLAGVALEKHGAERKIIVKAMRDWCKANDVPLDRSLRVCMSAISKAVVAIKSAPNLSPDELAASIARGKDAFGADNCGRCHASNGTGGASGPDLTDGAWLHCDGSVDCIRKLILSGIPQSKVKDKGRTNAMPAALPASDDSLITDLAIYVNSLSQK